MLMKRLTSIITMILTVLGLFSQEKIMIYPKGPKESNELKTPERFSDPEFIVDISEPRMTVFLAPKEKANGTAVLICPGGGYGGVAQVKEGDEIAKWFNQLGVTAFVLYYRMPNGHYKIPLKDAQTAFSIIRHRAKEWNIDKNKIGVMGFSAGGHLASTVGTHFKCSAQRPAFMILAYPVVTMNELTHGGSRTNLLGEHPSEKLKDMFSNELQVTKRTPPTFMVHAEDDDAVPVANSKNMLKALQDHGVPAKLQLYEKGGHGFGMRKQGIPADEWPEVLKAWLAEQRFI